MDLFERAGYDATRLVLDGSREKKKLMLYRDLDVISEISPKEHT